MAAQPSTGVRLNEIAHALHLGELCGIDTALCCVEEPRQEFGCRVQFAVEAESEVGKLPLGEPEPARTARTPMPSMRRAATTPC